MSTLKLISKTEKKSKKIDRLFKELKILNDELDDCLFDNCTSIMSKDELMGFINKCKEKTKHLTGMKKFIKNSSCKINFLNKHKKFNQKFDEIMKCYQDKCSEKKQKYFDLTYELTGLINPSVSKVKKYDEQLDKLYKRQDKCYFDKCEHIFPNAESTEIFNKCNQNNPSSKELDKCVKTDFMKKNQEKQECRKIKCKSVNDQIDPKIKILTAKLDKISEKTESLFIIAKEKYQITDRDF